MLMIFAIMLFVIIILPVLFIKIMTMYNNNALDRIYYRNLRNEINYIKMLKNIRSISKERKLKIKELNLKYGIE